MMNPIQLTIVVSFVIGLLYHSNEAAPFFYNQLGHPLAKSQILKEAIIKKYGEATYDQIMDRLQEEVVQQQRLQRCIAILGSKAVCKNEVGFYLWAQMMAKDIMNGQ